MKNCTRELFPSFPAVTTRCFSRTWGSRNQNWWHELQTGMRKRWKIHYNIDDSSSATRKTRKSFMLSKKWRSMTTRAELTDFDMRENSFSVWKMSDEILKKFSLPLYTQFCGFSNWIVTKQSQCEATWRRTKTSEITSLPWNLRKTFLTLVPQLLASLVWINFPLRQRFRLLIIAFLPMQKFQQFSLIVCAALRERKP